MKKILLLLFCVCMIATTAMAQPLFVQEKQFYTGTGGTKTVTHSLGVVPKTITLVELPTSYPGSGAFNYGPLEWSPLWSYDGVGNVWQNTNSIYNVTSTSFNVVSICHKNTSGHYYMAIVSWWSDSGDVADINGDGDVNLEDFAILAEHWLE